MTEMVVNHAAVVHGIDITPEPVDLARVALKRLELIGKNAERDRRPTRNDPRANIGISHLTPTDPVSGHCACLDALSNVLSHETRSLFVAFIRALDDIGQRSIERVAKPHELRRNGLTHILVRPGYTGGRVAQEATTWLFFGNGSEERRYSIFA
ncbi:MAG: hypothetical protein AAGE76_00960 [Pseudomonadota bacterium]